MSRVPEIIIGRPREKWTDGDVWNLRLIASLLGGFLWVVLGFSIMYLNPHSFLSHGVVTVVAILYAGGIFLLSIKVIRLRPLKTLMSSSPALGEKEIPSEEKISSSSGIVTESLEKPDKQAIWERLFYLINPPHQDGDKESKRSMGVTILNVFEILVGVAFVLLISGNQRVFSTNLFPVVGVMTMCLMIGISVLSLMRIRWIYVFFLGIHGVIGVVITIPIFQLFYTTFLLRHNAFIGFICIILILTVWAATVFGTVLLLRPPVRRHFR